MAGILYAPILQQAGFLGGESSPQVNYVARLDGATQAWQLSAPLIINENEDFKISITVNMVYGSGVSWLSILSGNSFGFDFTLNAAKRNGRTDDYRFRSGLDVDTGIQWEDGIEDNVVVQRVAGVIYTSANNGSYQFTETGGFSVDYLGRLAVGGDFLSGYLKNFKVEKSGIVTNEIKLTNKAQGATQLATVGDINAFMNNYTQTVWEED